MNAKSLGFTKVDVSDIPTEVIEAFLSWNEAESKLSYWSDANTKGEKSTATRRFNKLLKLIEKHELPRDKTLARLGSLI